MKILLLSLWLIFSGASSACKLNRPVVSLSGSTTLALAGLHLLNDPNLKAISVFHPVDSTMKIRRLPGGVFISPRILSELGQATFIYDESLELSKTLKQNKVDSIQIVTRGLTPYQAVELTLKKILPLLNKCDQQLENYQKLVNDKILNLKKKISRKLVMIFFLGEIRNGKYPNLIISNDGISKWLREEQLIESYPSDLAYIQWSSKILSKLKFDYAIGIKDTGADLDKKITSISKTDFNLFYPGALIPGEGQVDALNYFFKDFPPLP